jgi:hypothetical protein
MEDAMWGLLGPETAVSLRRTRTLGLGAAVRCFNDLAVPGLGGAWFGKQLFLAILGVAVAEKARSHGLRVQNIPVTNAIEALACRLGLEANGWKPDPRLRGARKMRHNADLSFVSVRRPTFYVTQPMRQATVQPLRALGLAESAGERFNAFSCTPVGQNFIKVATAAFKPYYSRTVVDHVTSWVMGDTLNVWSLTEALSPLEPMSSPACEILRERVAHGSVEEASRREAALRWVAEVRDNAPKQLEWSTKPPMLDEAHWRDLHSGALFFAVRDAAVVLLDRVEAHIGNQSDEQRLSLDAAFPAAITEGIQAIRASAATFLERQHDPSPDGMAIGFCQECTNADDATLLAMLVARCEGRGLQHRSSGDIVPGVAFRGAQASGATARSAEEDGVETEVEQAIPLPDHISNRVRNLFLLHLDLHHELDEWLGEPADDVGAPP